MLQLHTRPDALVPVRVSSICASRLIYHSLIMVSVCYIYFTLLSYYSAAEIEDNCGFYDEDPSLPVYQWTKPKQHYSIEELANILIVNPVAKEKICTKQPVRVSQNVAFVVDLHSLDDPLDIRADENGVWNRKGSPVAYISVHTDSGKTRIFKRSRMGNHPHHFKVTRTYYRHSSSPDFSRIITTVNGE